MASRWKRPSWKWKKSETPPSTARTGITYVQLGRRNRPSARRRPMTPKVIGMRARSLCWSTTGSAKISVNRGGPHGQDSGSDVEIRYKPKVIHTNDDIADQGQGRGRQDSHAIRAASVSNTTPAMRWVYCE